MIALLFSRLKTKWLHCVHVRVHERAQLTCAICNPVPIQNNTHTLATSMRALVCLSSCQSYASDTSSGSQLL